MARATQDDLFEIAKNMFEAEVDETGVVDLVSERGSVIVAAEPELMKAAFKRIKKVKAGYRWVVINREDLFAANSFSIGSKSGIMDAEGGVLKNADIPRKKV